MLTQYTGMENKNRNVSKLLTDSPKQKIMKIIKITCTW